MHRYHSISAAISIQIKSFGEFLFQQELYRNRSIDWRCKSIEWFLYKHVPIGKKFQKRL